ncbi:arsenic resistance protein [Actinoplanes sp. TBRC 11911]|nr:arsenic resistance protein [Actinoplanes sp. TBRC 11911]
MNRYQVAVYLGAIAAGAAIGRAAPEAGPGFSHAINPVLAALLYVTFLQVPARELARSLRDGRFLGAALVVNFVVVPLVVAAMVPFLPGDSSTRTGVLLVLLCPCVDYVIVFSGLAGADNRRLLAATPLLLIVQMALLPVFLGGSTGPLARAFLTLIVIPLALAWATHKWARRLDVLSVPLMAATLLVVVASQIARISFAEVAAVVPCYVLFLVVMAFAGLGVARLFRLDVPAGRAVVFTGATRNSLVVLPLALALSPIVAAVVVTQTLVEVLGMLAYVRLVPRLVR